MFSKCWCDSLNSNQNIFFYVRSFPKQSSNNNHLSCSTSHRAVRMRQTNAKNRLGRCKSCDKANEPIIFEIVSESLNVNSPVVVLYISWPNTMKKFLFTDSFKCCCIKRESGCYNSVICQFSANCDFRESCSLTGHHLPAYCCSLTAFNNV